jgi:hypothetical protein
MKSFLFNLVEYDWVENLFHEAQCCGADSVLYDVDHNLMVIDGYKDDLDWIRRRLESPKHNKLAESFRNWLANNMLKEYELENPQLTLANLDSKTLKADFVKIKLKPNYLRLPYHFRNIVGMALDCEAKSILYTEGKPVGLTVILPKKYEYEFFDANVCFGFLPEPPICLADSSKHWLENKLW